MESITQPLGARRWVGQVGGGTGPSRPKRTELSLSNKNSRCWERRKEAVCRPVNKTKRPKFKWRHPRRSKLKNYKRKAGDWGKSPQIDKRAGEPRENTSEERKRGGERKLA